MADEPKKTKLSCALAVWDDKKLLILGRTKWLSEGTPWIMPGGGFDSTRDKYLEDTIAREVEEEIGITIDNTDELNWYKNYLTEWAEKFVIYETKVFGAWYVYEHGMLDSKKFFGLMWLDTSNKQMLDLFWPQLMPGLRMYLKDKLSS